MFAVSGKWVEQLARAVAIAGGLVLCAVALMTMISIVGRAGIKFGLSPISGDFELVEAGIAFVICAFLPWCQLKRGHASVAIFTDRLGKIANLIVDLLADALLLMTSVIMTWRHIIGLFDKQRYGETTFILQYPLWWAYLACLFGLVAWIIVGTWAVANSADILKKSVLRAPLTGASR